MLGGIHVLATTGDLSKFGSANSGLAILSLSQIGLKVSEGLGLRQRLMAQTQLRAMTNDQDGALALCLASENWVVCEVHMTTTIATVAKSTNRMTVP